jgi:hypothetical protein
MDATNKEFKMLFPNKILVLIVRFKIKIVIKVKTGTELSEMKRVRQHNNICQRCSETIELR